MGAFFSFTLAASVFILLLYPLLRQIVNRSTWFGFNRAVIVLGMLLSLVFPLIISLNMISFQTDAFLSDSGIPGQ